eukprot:9473348-Pyramimonas_sp.AAC.1
MRTASQICAVLGGGPVASPGACSEAMMRRRSAADSGSVCCAGSPAGAGGPWYGALGCTTLGTCRGWTAADG